MDVLTGQVGVDLLVVSSLMGFGFYLGAVWAGDRWLKGRSDAPR